uniref:alkaline phosphatase n=1 Tax=Biomphalaria glabrata TaxID=6526 RepID=A0A2C9LV67_BIOGL
MSQIFIFLFTMSFISWSNGLNLQVYDPLDILESKYNQLISQRLSSGSFNTKATSNVILFLVEGLDSHTMSAARKITRETTPTNAMDTLDNFITGLIKPHSRDHMVGDPASSSSSIFSGLPERNGQMGWIKQENNTCLQRDQSKKVANLFKTMSAAGKYTALIATAPLTSPGVAGTYASSPDMKLESDIHVKEAACTGFSDIARQLIMEHRQLNVIVGTGRNYFHFKNKTDELTGKLLPDARSDNDLKDIWSVNLRVKNLPHKVAIGKASVSAALASEANDFVLGE